MMSSSENVGLDGETSTMTKSEADAEIRQHDKENTDGSTEARTSSNNDNGEATEGNAEGPQYPKRPIFFQGSTPLNGRWCFWYTKSLSGQIVTGSAYLERLVALATFDSVEGFWSVYNHLLRCEDIPRTATLHLFREGITPLWEDQANRRGGKLMVRRRKGMLGRWWESLMLFMIGEQFNEYTSEICGAVLATRKSEDVIALWYRNADSTDSVENIRAKFREALFDCPDQWEVENKRHDLALSEKSSYRNTERLGSGAPGYRKPHWSSGRGVDEGEKGSSQTPGREYRPGSAGGSRYRGSYSGSSGAGGGGGPQESGDGRGERDRDERYYGRGRADLGGGRERSWQSGGYGSHGGGGGGGGGGRGEGGRYSSRREDGGERPHSAREGRYPSGGRDRSGGDEDHEDGRSNSGRRGGSGGAFRDSDRRKSAWRSSGGGADSAQGVGERQWRDKDSSFGSSGRIAPTVYSSTSQGISLGTPRGENSDTPSAARTRRT